MILPKETLIIVLNWNGSQDTLECCKSLNVVNEVISNKAQLLILDNNSNSEALNLLEEGLSEIYGEREIFKIDSLTLGEYSLNNSYSFKNESVYLIKSTLNHGFARGCNIGVAIAKKLKYQNILFLNNDTIVEKDFLTQLLKSLKINNGVIPQIRYFQNKNVIWNCGGNISKLGKRKYYFANKNVNEIEFPAKEFEISFATGCCLLFKTEYFDSIGLFSERFFFGEEDVELALRLLKIKSELVCNVDSLIYHKVGASIQGDSEKLIRKAYIHYLNRFVNMKFHLGKLWYIWLMPSLIKVFFNLKRINKVSSYKAMKISRKLLLDAIKLDRVDKAKFEHVLTNGIE